MKKIFGFGKKRERQQSPSRPASGGATASPSGGEGGSLSGGGYEVWRSKDLGKLHRAAATGDLKKLQQLVRKHDLNQLDKANRAIIGEIDEETDSALDLGNIQAEPLNSVVH
ncbi:ankyrin repeat domain-containing protein 7-like [Hemicordylus capensis]|uniref:ankyrin repeat domain-containing protein 7-like n=1 Tax=Hemicordylus capensis TaxID=884348 RepID=UPI002303E82E|nr:ankyrin repeat domain-containing protein 7-like [Hemicordylus capensis]